jgi:hypothetical protein
MESLNFDGAGVTILIVPAHPARRASRRRKRQGGVVVLRPALARGFEPSYLEKLSIVQFDVLL